MMDPEEVGLGSIPPEAGMQAPEHLADPEQAAEALSAAYLADLGSAASDFVAELDTDVASAALWEGISEEELYGN